MLFRLSILVLAMVASGCVTSTTAQNWKPDTRDRDSGLYQCLQEAQQGHSTGSYTASRGLAVGSSQAGAKTNCEWMNSCMRSKGYRKREVFSLV